MSNGKIMSQASITALVGHLATQRRKYGIDGAQEQLQTANEGRQQARERLDSAKAEVKEAQNLHRENDTWCQRWSAIWFGENKWEKATRLIGEGSVRVEEAQALLLQEQEHLEKTQGEAKDVYESFDASREVLDNMFRDLTDASAAMVRV